MKKILKLYLNEIENISPLNHKDICKLHKEGKYDIIVHHFQPFIYKTCIRYSKVTNVDVIDLIGSASLGLLQGLKNYNTDGKYVGSITKYCYRYITYEITKRSLDIIGSTRHYHYNVEEDRPHIIYDEDSLEVEYNDDIIHTINTEFEAEFIKDIVDILKDDEKFIIQKIFYDGISQKDVANELNVSEGNVSVKKQRALNKLKVFYLQYEEAVQLGIDLHYD